MPGPPLPERLTAQALAGEPLRTPEQVAERLLAVQGQDPRGARLAVRARTAGLTAADVDRALSGDRSLLITWLNRGTLHLVRSEDYPWLHALTTPPLLTSSTRRLRQEGVSEAAAERGVETIERSLAEEGPLTRPQLRERLDSAGVRTEGQALVHVLFLATLRGVAVRGPMAGREHAYALTRDWIGPQPAVDREAALAELARRYLVGHGPADDRDLARWAGLPLRDARAGLAVIAAELVERDDGLLDLAGRPAARAGTAPAPARSLRPAAARLDLARGSRRPPQDAGHQQRDLPPLRPPRRPRRRHLALHPRPGRDRVPGAGAQTGRGGPGIRGRRGRALSRELAARLYCCGGIGGGISSLGAGGAA